MCVCVWCRAFQGWASRVAEKKGSRQQLIQVSQLFMHGSLARCFQAWHQDTLVSRLPSPSSPICAGVLVPVCMHGSHMAPLCL